MYTKFDGYFFGKEQQEQDYFRKNVSLSLCCKFKHMQIIRLFLFILTLGVWGAMFYVNVKKCIMYLNFWALTATLIYLCYVIPNSGKIRVEETLLKSNKIENHQISSSWKRAVIYYSVAWPLTVTSCLTFSLFFFTDQICATYLDFGFSQWRFVVVVLATYLPALVLIVELFINRVPLQYNHLSMNLIIIAVYIAINWLSQLI